MILTKLLTPLLLSTILISNQPLHNNGFLPKNNHYQNKHIQIEKDFLIGHNTKKKTNNEVEIESKKNAITISFAGDFTMGLSLVSTII